MLLGRKNSEIIDDIFLRCSEKLEKQLFLFDTLLEERETLGVVEESLYLYVAGSILMLVPDGSDTSNNPQLEREANREVFEEERRVVLRYLNTLIHFEVGAFHDEAHKECIDLLKNTTRTFNQDFLNVVYLIILFDHDAMYRYLCRPLAIFCATIVDNEFKKEQSKLRS